MKIELPGIILFTEHYAQCVAFYRDVIGLPVVLEKPTPLTIFNFGGVYLMIESAGIAKAGEKTRSENPTILRFNVTDVAAAADELRAKGLAVDIHTFDWGVIGGFCDPDGNRCELKDHSENFHGITKQSVCL